MPVTDAPAASALLQFGLTAFVMLIVVVNPLSVAPVYVSVTAHLAPPERRTALRRAVLVAFGTAVGFALVGRLLLAYLGVSMHAFAISGGILLFTLAFPMLFGQRPAVRSGEPAESTPREDVAIFPLAIPQLAGPGTIATVLLLSTQAAGDPGRTAVLLGVIVAVYLVSWPTLLAADRLLRRLGTGGTSVMGRILGLVLAALAVQYVLNGIAGFYASLPR
jgi:multiple antibiotic resistance protein